MAAEPRPDRRRHLRGPGQVRLSAPADKSGGGPARVAVLLSTFNGRRFIEAQLDSILGQTYADWTLFWRDDGSTDGTLDVLRRFADGAGKGRCREVAAGAHLGITGSFFALLRAAAEEAPIAAAFADQDDVWLPDKLERGLQAMAELPPGQPALYCARQVLVDQGLVRIGVSSRLRRTPSFAAALTQNIATGCTVLLNPAAIRLVAGSDPPAVTLHDWWSYLVVAGAGGTLVADETPVVLYRQHPGSFVGAPTSFFHRAAAALRRGPSVFMRVMRQHVEALSAQSHLLSPPARAQLGIISEALRQGPAGRIRALRKAGFNRQTFPENLLFAVWFVIG